MVCENTHLIYVELALWKALEIAYLLGMRLRKLPRSHPERPPLQYATQVRLP